MSTSARRGRVASLLAMSFTIVAGVSGASESVGAGVSDVEAFKIYTHQPGVYQVTFEDLVEAGLPPSEIDSAALALTRAGHQVPIRVADRGDGRLGPGDHIELIAEVLAGESAFFHEYSSWNVYRLTWQPTAGADPGLRMVERRSEEALPESSSPEDLPSARWRRSRHIEEDRLMIRVPGSSAHRLSGLPELWFWHKMTHLDRKPWKLPLQLGDLDPRPGAAIALRIHLLGLSSPHSKAVDQPDHQVDVAIGGTVVGVATWDGKAPYLFELELAVDELEDLDRVLELSVPKRPAPRSDDPLVDVVMVNWVEIDYPRRPVVDSLQVEASLEAPAAARLRARSAERLVAYGNRGSRIESDGDLLEFAALAGETIYHLVPDESFLEPAGIEPDLRSKLARTDLQADYLMIAHSSLLEAAAPLAELHRQRGLTVHLIDVEDIYDEFNHGVLHPRAIRDFVAHAYHHWQKPAPRFVLLVGDASWDTKNASVDDANYANWTDRFLERGFPFQRKPNETYAEDPDLNRRLLIPTWNFLSRHGQSASDNYFVAVDGDDHKPDLAIGRLTVVEPKEVRQIVDKIVPYVSSPEVGPWRRSVLFITNESKSLQRRSDRLAESMAGLGFASEKIYPLPSEPNNEHHTGKILEILDRGQLAVHFLGHGGRNIWRTGPPDPRKKHDLFTLDHLEQLEPHGRLPVVLSMTCFTAPFDHPNADSIGEKLLRIPERGAIAVLGASWRNYPAAGWGRALFDELTVPGTTIGGAVMRAKQRIHDRMFLETYNLLGDPAVPMPLPASRIQLSAAAVEAGGLRVEGEIELDGFAGELLVEVVGAGGEILRAASRPAASEFVVTFEASPELAEARGVQAYAWDSEAGRDASGTIELEPVAAEATAEEAASAF